jgi:hypothetical protein
MCRNISMQMLTPCAMATWLVETVSQGCAGSSITASARERRAYGRHAPERRHLT